MSRIYRKRMKIYGGQKMALAKMKGIRKEVLMHGHGLREIFRGLMHTQHEECNPHDEHDEMQNDKGTMQHNK